MEIKEEDVSFSRLKLMTQTQDSKSKLMTQERIFSIIINQIKKRKEQSMDDVSRYDSDVPHA